LELARELGADATINYATLTLSALRDNRAAMGFSLPAIV
jgi:hypothetical protein